MDHNEFRKAFEAEMHLKESEEQDAVPSETDNTIPPLQIPEIMIRLAKEAQAKKSKLIGDLTNLLNDLSEADKASRHARAAAKIISTAKQLTILDVLISSAAITCGTGIEDTEELLKTILRINLL